MKKRLLILSRESLLCIINKFINMEFLINFVTLISNWKTMYHHFRTDFFYQLQSFISTQALIGV